MAFSNWNVVKMYLRQTLVGLKTENCNQKLPEYTRTQQTRSGVLFDFTRNIQIYGEWALSLNAVLYSLAVLISLLVDVFIVDIFISLYLFLYTFLLYTLHISQVCKMEVPMLSTGVLSETCTECWIWNSRPGIVAYSGSAPLSPLDNQKPRPTFNARSWVEYQNRLEIIENGCGWFINVK